MIYFSGKVPKQLLQNRITTTIKNGPVLSYESLEGIYDNQIKFFHRITNKINLAKKY